VDVLSDVLNAVRLTGAIYFEIRARAPWVAASPCVAEIAARVMPGFEHVIAFHFLLDGAGFAYLADESEPAVPLEAGDAVVFAGGDAHFVSSERGIRGTPNLNYYYAPKDRSLPLVIDAPGGEGDSARLVCGFIGCDAGPFNPIVDVLPRTLRVRRAREQGTLSHELVRVALQETERPRPGGETFLAKASELLFLQALRQYAGELPPEATGWFAGLRDDHVGAALRLMHGRLAEPWTLETLAKNVGVSRSVFSERFMHVMGVPPMQYLGNWRLQVASRLLLRENMTIAAAAAAVGYESEAAFNRAFKRRVGAPPGVWRRTRIASTAR
jgi:AraC-like DNA-binding protein